MEKMYKRTLPQIEPVLDEINRATTLFELRTVTDPQISPNGSLIACSISEIDRERDTYRSSIWLYEDGAAPR